MKSAKDDGWLRTTGPGSVDLLAIPGNALRAYMLYGDEVL